jgi:hypothetical protein
MCLYLLAPRRRDRRRLCADHRVEPYACRCCCLHSARAPCLTFSVCFTVGAPPCPCRRRGQAVKIGNACTHWEARTSLLAAEQPVSCALADTRARARPNLCPQPCPDPVTRVVRPCRGRGIPHAGAHSFAALGKPKSAPLAILGDLGPCCFQQLGKPCRQQASSLRRPFWGISSRTSWPGPKTWMALLLLTCTHA